VEIESFKSLEDKDGFMREVFTEEEMASIGNGRQRGASASRLFSIKEAVFKAFGCGLSGGSYWLDVLIKNPQSIVLSGFMKEKAVRKSIGEYSFSSSVCAKHAISIVILEENHNRRVNE